jgi:glycerophosphoryl diester phosphodiesterase
MQQRLPSLFDEPLLFAHRGASAHAQENTLAAFTLAQKLGATGMETDIWVTSDQQIVIDHDGFAKKGLRKKPISELSRSELPSHMPTLDEMIDAIGIDIPISIDVKDDAAFGIIGNYRLNENNIWLCHPSLDVLISHRAALPNFRLVNSVRLTKIKEGPERRAASLAQHSIDALNMHMTDWNGGLVALTHRFGIAAFGWDLQHVPVMIDALRMGLDAIYSDWVDRLIDARSAL